MDNLKSILHYPYLVVDGLDGSGKSYFVEKFSSMIKCKTIKPTDYKMILQGGNEWWKEKQTVIKHFESCLEINCLEKKDAEKYCSQNTVIQERGLITTYMIHSYFQKKKCWLLYEQNFRDRYYL